MPAGKAHPALVLTGRSKSRHPSTLHPPSPLSRMQKRAHTETGATRALKGATRALKGTKRTDITDILAETKGIESSESRGDVGFAVLRPRVFKV